MNFKRAPQSLVSIDEVIGDETEMEKKQMNKFNEIF